MAQKDKVKELVGRGLNSYHTKALQQIDRIEKKNKEQNHKISILSNELDNDYLTKTEEGSVVSLEHSKEGMVYLDELQGNTMVNYCTDGAKELTLNGDIDVEGTNVTFTEGVDNGLVDVMCEGNTLVNIWSREKTDFFIQNGSFENGVVNCTAGWCCSKNVEWFKPNTEYTVITYVISISGTDTYLKVNDLAYNGVFTSSTEANVVNKVGIFVDKLTTKSTITSDVTFGARSIFKGEGSITYNMIILEGDWTNKEVPPYFEGMKSVGELEDNKIEILSQNKNLCTVNSYSGVHHNKIETNIPCKKNTIYTLTFKDESDLNQSGGRGITLITHKTKTDKKDHGNIYTYAMSEGGAEYKFLSSGFTFNTGDCCYISLTSNNTLGVPKIDVREIQIEEGSQTSYSPHTFNKKEISLNEPLRSLPNGVKDEIIKQNGKWYVKRKLNETYIEVPSSGVTIDQIQDNRCRIIMADYPINIKPNQIITTVNVNCDKIPSLKQTDLDGASPNYSYGISTRIATTKGIYMWVTKDKMPNQTLDGFKDFIKNNQPKIVYELETPIYEEITDGELITYLDTTHISNNSTIPCNMQVKNTGYNAIIKPSTQYTVALDTDKSGTIGINLGGAKVATTNNVATITTPATLADDSLRIYGKGIKGSKVRLLEGDKTNWIPSHFEGMKSSFEDKLQEDGSYKMEILSSNKNLFDAIFRKAIENNANNLNISFKDGKLIVNGNAQHHHIFNVTIPKGTYITSSRDDKLFLHVFWKGGDTSFKSNVVTYDKDTDITCYLSKGEYTNYECSFQIEKNTNVTDFVAPKTNKIQFSSIEPLRGLDNNVKDRFIFVDGKLKIKRECGKIVFNGIENWAIYPRSSTVTFNNTIAFQSGFLIGNTHNMDNINLRNNLVPNQGVYTRDIEGIFEKNSFRISVNKNRLKTLDVNGWKEFLSNNNLTIIYPLAEPTYEEVPFELQKIILEGYENGTLFFETNIPPTSTVTYSGETPIVKSVKLNKTEVLNNTNDINDNIIPYLMDMDYRVVCLQLATEEIEGGVSVARLFGGAYEMLKRDILSKRLTREEYGHRLADYFNAGKLTEEQVRELEDLR